MRGWVTWIVFLAVVRGASSISPALGGALLFLWLGTGVVMLFYRWAAGGAEDAPEDTGRPAWMKGRAAERTERREESR